MAKLKEYNGHFCECEYEDAFINLLQQENWEYCRGDKIERVSKSDVLIKSDIIGFLKETTDLNSNEIERIYDQMRLIGGESHFVTLHKVFNLLVDGINFTKDNGKVCFISLIDFENYSNNKFKVVNQLVVEYTNNGNKETRRPDVVLYVNGFPLCIIELKNPADANATIHDAWEQINIRYWRDIPHLLRYCPLACISDGVNTKLGTVRTPYEHFYSWRRVNNEDKVATKPFEETQTMIKGVYSPKRFLEIFRDYIYFKDAIYDSSETEIVCRYPQFFATRLLKQSIIKSVKEKSGKGGTYFGATGCGKTYTMAFLARQLSLRCNDIPEIGSPTIVMIVDREELQKQGAKLFTKSTEFLNIGEVSVIQSRNHLREELKIRPSGGFYICTIQKFCDREEDKIGLINDRRNIICFSDEAHRTQIEKSKKIQFTKDANQNMQALISKPYATVLREAFPNATFVGFTGTPISETYQTFGEEIDRYTMDQAVADGLTVSIKYHHRIAKVLLDKDKIKLIEEYYNKCVEEGATKDEVEKSKKAMSSMDIILGDQKRLDRLAEDIHNHYISTISNDPGRVQKAMITCSSREIGYRLLRTFERKYPEWFVEKKTPDDVKVSDEELKRLKPMPYIAMVSSVGKNDQPEMYNYLGGTSNDKRSSELDIAFKEDNSNFRIVIVVDMWITGFDVPSLTILYNDKPLQKHLLIQTISRVNRKYPGKDYGMIVDYIGIRDNMRKAMKIYGGDTSVAPTADDVEQATLIFKDELEILKKLFIDFNLEPFMDVNCNPLDRYQLLASAAEFVCSKNENLCSNEENQKGKKVPFKTYFVEGVRRLKKAYDICQPSGVLDEKDSALAQCFMAISGFVSKMNGTDSIDSNVMNKNVLQMVEEALKYTKVESVLEEGEKEDIFSEEFIEELKNIPLPATKLELLIKLLKKKIKEYKKTNKIAAEKFEEMLNKTIEEYHNRRKTVSCEEASEAQKKASEKIIEAATKQALELLEKLNLSKESFKKIGLTFEEKAFYDVLMSLRDEFNFEYGVDKNINGEIINEECKELAKEIKKIIDRKTSFVDWLNNRNVRDDLNREIKMCLIKHKYPPKYSSDAYSKIIEQVENFEKNNE